MSKHILILGANSNLAGALAREFAKNTRAQFYLASRNMELLYKRTRDLEIRYGISAKAYYFDALDYVRADSFYSTLDPKPEGVIVALGYLGDQTKAQSDFGESRAILETNFLSIVRILEIISSDFAARGNGFIIGVSSVAGERGRQSNYIYGSAKAGLSTYLSGLRNRLHAKGIHVMTVLPGFMNTKMTTHLNLPGFLVTDPAEAARQIYRGYTRKKDILYVKWHWQLICLLLRLIPESIFKRLNL